MELTLDNFENINLLSNRNLENVVKKLVNESSNACFVNMGSDSVILYDHVEGDFYIADYDVDKENLVFEFTNFEKIELIESEENAFEETANSYFDDEVSLKDLKESYSLNEGEKYGFLNSLISESISAKDFTGADYTEIKSLKEEELLESEELSIVEAYKKRLDERPTTSIKLFDWEKPVKATLIENEVDGPVKTNLKKKAREIWKDKEFKKSFLEAISTIEEDVEEAQVNFENLIEENPFVMSLKESELREVFGKMLLTSNFKSNRKEVLEGVIGFTKEDSVKNLFEEDDEEEDDEEEDDDGEEGEEDEVPEPSEKDIEKISGDLKKIADKTEDEETKEKLEDLISKIKGQEKEGTDSKAMKEAVSILMM